MPSNQKVVVTGGEGFIGTHLVRALTKEGYEVEVVDLKSGRDVRDTALMRSVCTGATYVFHLAALPRVQFSIEQPQESNDTNIDGTLSVLVAARDAGVKKVIYSASSSAYGDTAQMPLRETMPARPMSPYALQKHVGELYCRLFFDVYALPTVSLRYFNVYGPGADPHGAYALVIAKFLQQRIEGLPLTITGDGTQTRDFTHVYDVVRANILAARSAVGAGEVVNIGAGNNASVKRVAELVGGPVTHIPARFEPHDSFADNALAKKLFGWSPGVTLEEGVAELKQQANLL